MVGLLVLIFFTTPSFAQSDSTGLEGWQFDDDSRSSWDIFWTCLSTILACTWTALHLAVPNINDTESKQTIWKLLTWICAVLAPELMAGLAAEELLRARALVARCNAAFFELPNEPIEPATTPPKTSIEETQGSCGEDTLHQEKNTPIQPKEVSTRVDGTSRPKEHASSKIEPKPSVTWWSTVQGFCLTMNGVLLQTKDGWTYPVQPNNVITLIEAGVVKPFHLRARDIKDRAKADSFAKGFTLLQSLWVICNIIARRAYSLPISPLEYSTVAYVACAAVTYITWWHKPRDMATPILIFLPYNKDDTDMPTQIKKTLDEGHGSWIRPQEAAPENSSPLLEQLLMPLRIAGRLLILPFTPKGWKHVVKSVTESVADIKETSLSKDQPPSSHHQDEENAQPSKSVDEPQQPTKTVENSQHGSLSILSMVNLTNFYMFVALLFCGIHVAA